MGKGAMAFFRTKIDDDVDRALDGQFQLRGLSTTGAKQTICYGKLVFFQTKLLRLLFPHRKLRAQ